MRIMGSKPEQEEGSYETLRSKASHEFLALNLFLVYGHNTLNAPNLVWICF